MSVGEVRVADPQLRLTTSDFWELEELYEPWQAEPAPEPELVVFNHALADELGLDAEAWRSPNDVAALIGGRLPEGASPVAQAYAGHQFGGFSPRLGDGRALLLGEVLDRCGHRRDVHLKGSGPTPFARGGDGRAALGPMLREYLIGEAMHALGIPTTRALAVVTTGRTVARDALLPAAVLTRVAASHLRVGTFEYAAAHGGPALVRRLADHAIARHHPSARDAPNPYLAFYEHVVDAQASLVASWMLVGFVHGVMNTDNMTVAGETIDYGPCAFMDAFDPATVFSSIDHTGRYAYGNQPRVAQWNLARLAESMLALFDEDVEAAAASASTVLASFADRYERGWTTGMSAKLGLANGPGSDAQLIDDLLALLHADGIDFTSFFRALSASVATEPASVRQLFTEPTSSLDAWLGRWRAQLSSDGQRDARAIAEEMDRVNPVYVPRNHQVEASLAAATDGDLGPFLRLLDVVTHPFVEQLGLEDYAGPAPVDFGRYRTFCGT